MKKFKLLLILMMILCVTGCDKKQETPAEDKKEDIATSVPEEYRNTYADKIAGRATMKIEADTVTVDWPQSAAEMYHYEMPVTYNETDNTISYTNALLKNITYKEDGTSVENEVYNDGNGYFEVNGDTIIWHNEKENVVNEFIKVVFFESFNDDYQKASEKAGFGFDYPDENMLMIPVESKAIYACEGAMYVVYSNKDQTLVLGKTANSKLRENIFPVSSFANNWSESVKGANVECYGNGEEIQTALFDNGAEYFGVSYMDMSEESGNKGLSIEDITSLMMAMQ